MNNLHKIQICSGSGTQEIVIDGFTPLILLGMAWVQNRMTDLGDGHFEIYGVTHDMVGEVSSQEQALEFLALNDGAETEDEILEWVEILETTWHEQANNY